MSTFRRMLSGLGVIVETETAKELAMRCQSHEEWVPVPGFEEAYAVSTCGRVARTLRSPGARVRILKAEVSWKGYLGVELKFRGRRLRRGIAYIVLLAFRGPKPTGYQNNHRDGDKTNNHLSNLEYVTASQNIRHALFIGLPHGTRKLLPKAVLSIRKSSLPRRDLARLHAVSEQQISKIQTGRAWGWL